MQPFKLRIVFWGLLVLVGLVAASLGEADGSVQHGGRIYGRQEDEESTPTEKPTKAAETTEAPETTEPPETTEAPEETGKPSKTKTGEKSDDDKKTKTDEETTKKPTPTSVDPRSPAGQIEMLTPGVFDPVTYIKIGEYATFVWNYTNLIVSPTAIDVIAYCSRNDHSYTIAGNMSMQETGSVVWDTSAHETDSPHLLTEMYTLIVHDSEVDPSERPKPGHLGTNIRPTFGVYEPQEYDPNAKGCATCNNGAGTVRLERQAMAFMFGMVVITICSFTWAAGGLGLFN